MCRRTVHYNSYFFLPWIHFSSVEPIVGSSTGTSVCVVAILVIVVYNSINMGRRTRPNEDNPKRCRGRFLALLLFLVVIGCAVAFPIIFVLNKKDDSALTGEEPGVDVLVTFEATQAVLSDRQIESLEAACFNFFTANLAGLRLRGVVLTAQQLVPLLENLQNTQGRGIQTRLRVVPGNNAPLTSQQLARLVDQEGEELLDILRPADPSFDTFVRVYATAVMDPSPSAAPTIPETFLDDGTCNGLANLCDIPVNQVMFATMHNANADSSVILFVPNHNQDLMAGLNAGIRGLNMDLGFCLVNNENVLALMHATCVIGFSEARDVFSRIHNWLTAHPNQVILMPIQMENTGSPVRLREHVLPLFQSIVDRNGRTMADRLYAHPGPTTPWPTLGELIAADERILFFHYNSEETCAAMDCPRGFHDWFAYAAETEFAFASVADIQQNTARACSITRGASGTTDFFGVNLFLEIPNQDASAVLNGADFLESHLDACSEQSGLTPNLVLVDFWEQGDVIEFVNDRNAQLRPPSSTGIPSTIPTPSPIATNNEMMPVQQLAATPSPTSVSPPEPAVRTCNGLANLCNVPVDATLFATMHNANADNSSTFFIPNHSQDLLTGLGAGIRGLSIDIGMCPVNGELRLSLVHGVCFVGISDPLEVFAGINDFLQQNPNEVIIMPTQINDNTGGTVQLSDIYSVMERVVDSSGVSMADRLYAHPGTTAPWPTLGELIDLDKRILFFIYNGEQTCQNSACPVGFHDWFAYAMETRFEFEDAATILNDPEDACVVTRGGSSSTRSFFGVNVFTRIANDEASAQLNDAAFLRQHIETCSIVNNGKDPNLILVDFWSIGDVIQVAREYNENIGVR